MLRERGWLAVAVVLASMVGGVVSNLLLTARLDAQGADVVTASQINIVGSAGQRGLGLVVGGAEASSMSLFDAVGVRRLLMGTIQGSTVLNLGDGTRSRLVLGVADNGRASVAFYDADGALERDLSADAQR